LREVQRQETGPDRFGLAAFFFFLFV